MFSIRCNSRVKSRRNKKDPQRITKTQLLYINITGKQKSFYQKKIIEKNETNNATVTLNFFYAQKEKIYPAYFSKHNSNREKQVIF